MKKYFLTGLVIILPVVITLLIANFLIKFLTAPFMKATLYLLHSLHYTQVYVDPTILALISKILILILLLSVIIFAGFLGDQLFIPTIFQYVDRLIHKIPLANKIYKATQEVLQNIFVSSTQNFSKTVLIPFPQEKSLAIGFITQDNIPIANMDGVQDLVCVFVPGTPHPMMGFMIMAPKNKLTPTDLPLEEAIKFVVSCGVIYKQNG
jgi:uncharacterized membrane protein